MATATPLVLGHHRNVALLAGELVANRLRARPDLRLILPTGHTPLGMYEALRAHALDGSLAPEGATLFQLDEYLGLGPDDERSYRAYLRRELSSVDFGTFHGLDGSAADPDAECARHQALLDEAPIDLVVLGIGRDGHVAFDEPGSPPEAGVRRVRASRGDPRGRGRRLRRRPRSGPARGADDRPADAPRGARDPAARDGRGEGRGAPGDAGGRAGARLPRVAPARPSPSHGRLRRARGARCFAPSRAGRAIER